MSDEVIIKKRGRKPGDKGKCCICGQSGHYKSTCPTVPLQENEYASSRRKRHEIVVKEKAEKKTTPKEIKEPTTEEGLEIFNPGEEVAAAIIEKKKPKIVWSKELGRPVVAEEE